MADKLMYIANDDTQNYPFCRIQFLVWALNAMRHPIKREGAVVTLFETKTTGIQLKNELQH